MLSAENKSSCIDRLKLLNPMCFRLMPEVSSIEDLKKLNTKFKHKKSDDKKHKKAAVLVPLCEVDEKLGFLYQKRSKYLKKHVGQICFPGGMFDSSDKNLIETAIRETWEEMRIPKEKIDVWGCSNPLPSRDVSVLPVLGYIGKINLYNDLLKNINSDEVDDVFFHSLEKLCDPSLFRYTQFRDRPVTLPVFHGNQNFDSYYYRRIWGLTAMMTHIVMFSLVPEVYKHNLPYIVPYT